MHYCVVATEIVSIFGRLMTRFLITAVNRQGWKVMSLSSATLTCWHVYAQFFPTKVPLSSSEPFDAPSRR